MAKIKQTGSDVVFEVINRTLLILCLILVIYPLYFVVIASISEPNAVANGEIILVPKRITSIGYERIFQDSTIIRGYLNTIMYTVCGTMLSLFLTLPFAFALSRKYFKGAKFFMVILLITMFFNGGLIPTYLLMKQIGLVGSPLIVIIMGSLSAYNVIITRTYFQSSIPHELDEAAYIDGCSQTRLFFSVALPLSNVIISVLVLFYGVSYWNDFFKALIYISDRDWHPLQLILRSILLSTQMMSSEMVDADDVQLQMEMQKLAASIKYGTIVVATLPVIIIYPFLQKYFVQGVMIGSVKG